MEYAEIDAVLDAIGRLVPPETGFHRMKELELHSPTRVGRLAELEQQLGPAPQGRIWSYWMAVRDGGTEEEVTVAWATTLFSGAGAGGRVEAAAFLLFDLHSMLMAWTVSSIWRSLDIGRASVELLRSSRPVPAAATVRGLFEGVAAFAVEGGDLADKWRDFRSAGSPTHNSVLAFRAEFLRAIQNPLFGTRLTELAERAPQRTNILTLVDKFIRRSTSNDESRRAMRGDYDILCDVVHPSLGSHMAFWGTQGTHESGTWSGWTMRRSSRRSVNDTPSMIDAAISSALDLSIRSLERVASEMVSVAHDFGLTTGAATSSAVDYFGTFGPLGRNERCPCGSGVKAKNCPHLWGVR